MTLAAGGYTSNGSTGHLNLNVAPSDASLSQNSTPTQPTTGPLESGITNRLYEVNNAIAPYYASSFAITGINDSAFGTITSTDSQGRWAISRTASNLITLTKNGASIGTVRLASGSPSSVNFLHSQKNDGAGNPSNFVTPDQLGWFFIFTGLTVPQMASADSCLSVYATAWGSEAPHKTRAVKTASS